MKVVIPGGTGQAGTILNRGLTAAGYEVVILTRRPAGDREIRWDGETLGPQRRFMRALRAAWGMPGDLVRRVRAG